MPLGRKVDTVTNGRDTSVGSYTEKWQPEWMGRPNVYFLFGWSTWYVRASSTQ